MEWVCINNTWLGEKEQLTFSVRWRRGAWHWRAVFADGSAETAHFAGDNQADQPLGYLRPEDAMRAAERWFELLMGGGATSPFVRI